MTLSQSSKIEKRLVAVECDFNLILDMMFKDFDTTGYNVKTIEGLPAGAKMIREYYDHQHGTVVFIFTHETFDEVEDGVQLPRLRITHQRIVT